MMYVHVHVHVQAYAYEYACLLIRIWLVYMTVDLQFLYIVLLDG